MGHFFKEHNCQPRNFSHEVLPNLKHTIGYKIAFEHDRPERDIAQLETSLRDLGVMKIEWHR